MFVCLCDALLLCPPAPSLRAILEQEKQEAKAAAKEPQVIPAPQANQPPAGKAAATGGWSASQTKSKPQVNSLRDIMEAETQAAMQAAVKGVAGSQSAALKVQPKAPKGATVTRCSPRYWPHSEHVCWVFA